MPIGFGAGMTSSNGFMSSGTGMPGMFEMALSKKISSSNSHKEVMKKIRSKR